ncbi:hypothetical protein F2Q69_00011178 [Brassica cretica]|uniref:TF-B3 domain-containing protein n=1 Tax=Brassica cretica TaxID=69181 RepID=A0A8S9R7J4_BRACR|nr:hypothetical protein F2Q69_00011178 [Brassica cretica]
MSINQYSSEFHYHSLMWQQQQQHHHQNEVVEEKEALFEKPLTPSDVGKLNRLVIPKQHAERYFPLAAAAVDAVEKGLLLCFEDEEGKPWRFRYSYWNSSQSYVLTKGWSRYVKEKQLDAGDVVLFHRHRVDGGRFFIGWRRRGDSSSSSDSYRHLQSNASLQYYPHAGAQAVENQRGNSKTLRLFGVNMECQIDSDWFEPSTPDGFTTYSTNHDQFPIYPEHYPPPYYMYLEISLAGETKQVDLEYEKLDKHCFSCLSLSHEVKDCPSRTTSRNTADQNLGISQRRTLERIEENRRRTDNRKLSRFSPYDDPRTHRGSAPTHVNQSQYGHERNETRNHHYTERKEHSSDRSYSNRPYSVADNREKDSTRSREPRDRLPPVRESSEVSLRSGGMRVANPVAKNVWRPVSEGHGNGDHSNSIQSQVSHTPSPHPSRERITTPINTPQETSGPSGGQSGMTPSRGQRWNASLMQTLSLLLGKGVQH